MGLPSYGCGSKGTIETAEHGERHGESPLGSERLEGGLFPELPAPWRDAQAGGFDFSRRRREGLAVCTLGWSHPRSRVLAEISNSDCGPELFMLKTFE